MRNHAHRIISWLPVGAGAIITLAATAAGIWEPIKEALDPLVEVLLNHFVLSASFFISVSLLLYLIWNYTKPKPAIMKANDMGDTYKQNHSGSGDNVINVGKQPFRLTSSVLEEILAAVEHISSVEVLPHGIEASFPVAEKIVKFLQNNGIDAHRGDGVMMLLPPPNGPLELRGNQLIVDVSR